MLRFFLCRTGTNASFLQMPFATRIICTYSLSPFFILLCKFACVLASVVVCMRVSHVFVCLCVRVRVCVLVCSRSITAAGLDLSLPARVTALRLALKTFYLPHTGAPLPLSTLALRYAKKKTNEKNHKKNHKETTKTIMYILENTIIYTIMSY